MKNWVKPKPLIIVGSGVAESKDSEAIYKLVGEFASHFNSGWNGVNLLHREASRVAALDLGFNTLVEDSTKAKFIYLLGADEITNTKIFQRMHLWYIKRVI